MEWWGTDKASTIPQWARVVGWVLQSESQRINSGCKMPGRIDIRRVARIKAEVSWFDSQVGQIQASPFCMLPPHPTPEEEWPEGDPHTNQWENTNRTFKARTPPSIREDFREAQGGEGGRLSAEGNGKLQTLTLQPRSAASGVRLV